jgi:hypothetical protein
MSQKVPSNLSGDNVLRDVHNEKDNSLITSSFVTGKTGRKIESAISTTNVTDDTQTLTYSEDGTTIYTLRVIYTDGTRAEFSSVERIA